MGSVFRIAPSKSSLVLPHITVNTLKPVSLLCEINKEKCKKKNCSQYFILINFFFVFRVYGNDDWRLKIYNTIVTAVCVYYCLLIFIYLLFTNVKFLFNKCLIKSMQRMIPFFMRKIIYFLIFFTILKTVCQIYLNI